MTAHWASALALFSSLVVRWASATTNTLVIGAPSCPCALDNADLDGLHVMTDGYGLGCAAHDRNTSSARVAACSNTAGEVPSFCQSKWCFLKVGVDCNISADAEWSRTFPGLRYSYETCGYLNTLKTYNLALSLSGRSMRVLYLSNSGGWKGSFCDETGACNGPMPSFFSGFFAKYAINVELVHTFTVDARSYVRNTTVYAPQVIQGYDSAFPEDKDDPTLSAFGTCMMAAGMGYVDLCIGSFTINAVRTQYSNMISFSSEPVYLMTTFSNTEATFWENAEAAFKPFTGSLWGAVLVCLLAMSLTMSVVDFGKGDFEELPWWQAPVMAVYKGLESMFGAASSFAPQTVGAKITSLGLGFFILLTISAYTANLASLLVVEQGTNLAVTGMDDVVRNNFKVCTTGTVLPTLTRLFPNAADAGLFIESSNRIAALESVGGVCAAVATRLEDLQEVKSAGRMCGLVRVGDPIFYVSSGVAASEAVYRELKYGFAAYGEGPWQEALDLAELEDACGGESEENSEENSMPVESMIGAFLVAGAFGGIGVIVRCIQLFFDWRRGPQPVQTNDDEDESGEMQDEGKSTRISPARTQSPHEPIAAGKQESNGRENFHSDQLAEVDELVRAINALRQERDELEGEVSALNVRTVNNLWDEGNHSFEDGMDRAVLQRILNEVQTLKSVIDER